MTAIANLPDLRPSLLLDFANSGRVDPRIQCTRASSATCFGPDGKLRTVAANTPRIDYDPVTGKCLGLLVEESRTNLLTHSNAASAGWTATRATLTPTGEVFGGLPVTRYTSTEATNGYIYRLGFSSTFQIGKTYCLSAIIKKGTAPRCTVQFPTQNGFDGNHVLTILTDTLTTVTVAPANLNYGVKDLGGGLFLIWIAATCTKAPETPNYIPLSFPSTVLGDFIDICAIQLEEGAFPTSYIPTEGTAVTRAADYITMDLSRDYLNKGSVLISADIPALGGNPSPKLIRIINPSVDSYYEIVDAANGISATGYNGATYTFSRTASFGRSRELRAGLSWSGKDVVLGLNGDVLEVTQSGMPVPPLSQLRVLTAGYSSNRMSCGWVRGIAIYADYTNAAQVARLTA